MVNIPYIYTILRKKQVFMPSESGFLWFLLQNRDSGVYLLYDDKWIKAHYVRDKMIKSFYVYR